MSSDEKLREKQAQRARSIDFNNLADDALLREWDVLQVVPFSSPTFWRQVKAGKFPQPIRLAGSRVTCWRWGDVRAWLRAQLEQAA